MLRLSKKVIVSLVFTAILMASFSAPIYASQVTGVTVTVNGQGVCKIKCASALS